MSNTTDHRGSCFDVGCTVDIENTFENLHAHVELDGNPEIGPGDRVRVHGDPVVVRYGERLTLRRTATVRRAGALGRAWTRMTGDLECFELFDVSFTPEREL